jgi:hypothetical protein
MKATLTAIGLGAIVACACNGAFAQTVTTTQQGIANTSYTEQSSVETVSATATTIQIGNNNRAGDPDTRTPGIIQRNISSNLATARIYQNGNANTASIVQDTADIHVNADIEQVGNYNRAAITQIDNAHVDAWLRQTGTGNVAVLQQTNLDAGIRAVQNGSGNRLTFSQSRTALHTPILTQTGTQNEILFSQDAAALRELTITQTGDSNIVTGSQTLSLGPTVSIVQVGTGNNAALVQSGGSDSLILQNGNYNFASLNQLGDSQSFITQTGNHNRAKVVQIGDSFVASITQIGAYNRAGVYQH